MSDKIETTLQLVKDFIVSVKKAKSKEDNIVQEIFEESYIDELKRLMYFYNTSNDAVGRLTHYYQIEVLVRKDIPRMAEFVDSINEKYKEDEFGIGFEF